MINPNALTIGKLASQSGVDIVTIRYTVYAVSPPRSSTADLPIAAPAEARMKPHCARPGSAALFDLNLVIPPSRALIREFNLLHLPGALAAWTHRFSAIAAEPARIKSGNTHIFLFFIR